MKRPIQIRLGGYGPSTTCFSKGLKSIGERLSDAFGDAVDVKYVYNILDLGYRSEDILWLVESGVLTLGYQSTSYFTERVPELGVLDLPFVFRDKAEARSVMDGELGSKLAGKLEERMDCRVLGYFENGFRHISNRLRTVRTPQDLAGMRIRVLPSKIQARTFELLGAVPLQWDLTEALQAIVDGSIDAQENPLANTVTYEAHKFHRYHSLTGHSYLSRPIFVHRPTFESLPDDMQAVLGDAVTEAVRVQRALAIEEEREAEVQILAANGEIHVLTPEEHAAFREAVRPMLEEARQRYDAETLKLLPAF